MTAEELLFFGTHPGLIPLYETLREKILTDWPDTEIRTAKTQISFYAGHMFAMVSLPLRRKADWPKEFLLVSFGLPAPAESPRVGAKTEAAPGRWTHHVPVTAPEEIDAELLGWIAAARDFSKRKRR